KASNVKREPVAVTKLDTTQFLVEGSGRIWVDVTCIDFEAKIFEQTQFIIEIGSSPEPDEPDNPDEPDEPDNPDEPDGPRPGPDAYNNLAQRVYDQSRSLEATSRSAIAAHYKLAATSLRNTRAVDITAITTKLVEDTRASATEAWTPLFNFLQQDIDTQWSTRTDPNTDWLAGYYDAIATGLSN